MDYDGFSRTFNQQIKKQLGSANQAFRKLKGESSIDEKYKSVIVVFMYWYLACKYQKYVVTEGQMARPE